eukprot:699465_1
MATKSKLSGHKRPMDPSTNDSSLTAGRPKKKRKLQELQLELLENKKDKSISNLKKKHKQELNKLEKKHEKELNKLILSWEQQISEARNKAQGNELIEDGQIICSDCNMLTEINEQIENCSSCDATICEDCAMECQACQKAKKRNIVCISTQHSTKEWNQYG